MGLFYAYFKDANTDDSNRQVITFVDRDTADEWWRMISTPQSPYVGIVKRVSPQFYIQRTSNFNISSFFFENKLPGARRFLEKMFFTYLSIRTGENPTAIPSAEITDYISGRWYFIRSKANAYSHWCLRTNGLCLVCGIEDCNAIHVSGEHRTKFCVRVRGLADSDSQTPEDFVIIGRDEISIAAPRDHTIHIHDGNLKVSRGYQGGTGLLFGDLKNRFITRAEKQVNGETWEYVESTERGQGEIWELVD